MSNEPDARPALFRAEPFENSRIPPSLLGGRCKACGFVFFPMQHYGCEACGSPALHEYEIAGRGRLVTLARVHRHASPDREAPFTVGSVATDHGPVIRALLDPESADQLRPGDTVATRLVTETREGHDSHDLRFGKVT